MSDGEESDGRRLSATRRQILAAAGGVAGTASLAAAATSGGDDHLVGGDMALDKAHNVAGDLWTGPDAGKSNVKPETGRVYMAEDTQVDYIADGNSWTKMGVGSSQEPVPSINTESIPRVADIVIDGDDDPQSRIDAASIYDTVVAHPTEQHVLSSPLEITTDGLNVIGLNLKTGDGMNDTAVYIHSCSGVSLENCRVDGNKANQSGSNDIVNGVEVSNASDIWVTETEVINTQGQGVIATSRTADSNKANGAISNIHFERIKTSGVGNGDILLMGGGGLTAEHGWIVDCECESTTQDILNVGDGFQHAVVRGNTATGSGVGLALEQHASRGVDRALLGVKVSENTFNVSSAGIEIQYSADVFRDITITDCDFIGPNTGGVNGLQTNGTGQDVAGLSIENCRFAGWDKCVILDTAGNWGYTVSGCTFRDSQQGINTKNPTRFVCTDNDFIGLIDYGVNLISSSGTLSDAVIADNHGTGTSSNPMEALVWLHDNGGSFGNIRLDNNTAGPNVTTRLTLDEKLGVLVGGKSPRSGTGGLGTYAGNGGASTGTDTQTFVSGLDLEYVAVRGSDGTWYDHHRDFGRGYNHTDPTTPGGDITFPSGGGFTVSDGGSDADPNTGSETYEVYYEA